MLFKSLSVPVEKGARLLLVLVAAPRLGESGFGSYQLIATATALLMLGTEMGLGVWTTRAVARDRSRARAVVGVVLHRRGRALIAYFGVIAALVVAAGSGGTRAAIVWLALAALTNAVVDYAAAVFRGFERLEDEAWINVARAFLVAGGGIGAIYLRGSLGALAAGTAVGGVAAACCVFVLFRRRYGLLRGPGVMAYDRNLAKSAAAEGLPLWAITAVSLLYSRGDILIMRLFLGTAEIGAYSAADKVFEGLTIVTGIVLAALFPPMARAYGNREAQRRWEVLLTALLLFAGSVAGAVLYAGSVPIVSTIYGSGFIRAASPLRVLGLATPWMFLNCALTHILIARNLERRNLLFAGVALAVNVGANLILLPHLGSPGAAWATLATEVTMTLCCLGVLLRAGREAGASLA
jgi:O-antigen/teichoic acid export membrane protein